MELYINGKKADIIIENEKNISDIVSNLEQWLASSGHRMSGLSVNNKDIVSANLEKIFSMNIDSVNTLEIKTSSIADLTAESLINILNDINEFQSLKYEDKNQFIQNWKQSPQANFTLESMPDFYNMLLSSFSGNGLNSNSIFAVAEERLREVKTPFEELEKLKPLLDETCDLLTDFSLDVQTGKEARAAQTIQLFSGITEKMLRLTNQFNIQGILKNDNQKDKPILNIINELDDIIKNLLDAYERHDTVLAGDLAEYEACVKLKELYSALSLLSKENK